MGSDKVVKKCVQKMKKLKPKQKACKTLEKISKKDLDSILELIKKWNRQKVLKKDCKLDRGETKYHYVDRLANHFTIKEKKICNIFNGCYAASVRAKKNNEKEIKKKNAAAKLEWRAIGRIECLLKMLGGKGSKKSSKQLMKCVKGRQISTRPLNLRYYQKPGKPRCSLRGVNAKMRTLCKKGQKKRR